MLDVLGEGMEGVRAVEHGSKVAVQVLVEDWSTQHVEPMAGLQQAREIPLGQLCR